MLRRAAGNIRREHVEAFIAAELERTAPSSAATRSLRQLFKWLDEGKITVSLMFGDARVIACTPRPWRACRAERQVMPAWRGGSYAVAMAYERITIDPGRMRGLPCIRDTRVTVSAVLGQLAAGRTPEEVLADYPHLERADILAALEFAADAVQEHELPLARSA